jgi:hypothetical protein
MLEPGIPFLPWLVIFAVVIEAGDSKPGSVSTGLPRLRIEASGKGICFSEYCTIALQVILGDATLIHPQAQALVSDELYYPNSFIHRRVLRFGAI